MNEFKATHEITLLLPGGTAHAFEVQLSQGRVHTRSEWLRGALPQWIVHDGQWSHGDRSAPPGCVTLSIVPIAAAALDRIAWELADAAHGIQYDGRRLSFESRAGAPSLCLEPIEDHLRLGDGRRAFHVDVRASARWVRELVAEWIAAEHGR